MICGASQPPKGQKMATKIAGFLWWVAPIADGAGLEGCPRNLRLQTFSMDGVMDGGLWAHGWGGIGFWPIIWGFGGDLSALEEKYCDLAKVEVDEMSEKLERSKREDFERGRKVWRSKSQI